MFEIKCFSASTMRGVIQLLKSIALHPCLIWKHYLAFTTSENSFGELVKRIRIRNLYCPYFTAKHQGKTHTRQLTCALKVLQGPVASWLTKQYTVCVRGLVTWVTFQCYSALVIVWISLKMAVLNERWLSAIYRWRNYNIKDIKFKT